MCVLQKKIFVMVLGCLFMVGGIDLVMAEVDSSLVGYWSFDEGKGEIANDSSNKGNNGNIIGATATAGKIGQALSFDGINDYVDCGSNVSLNITDAITIEAWVKPVGVGVDVILVNGDGTNGDSYTQYMMYLSGTNLYARYGNGSSFITTPATAVIASQWNHVVYLLDSTHLNVYVNGIYKQQVARSIEPYAASYTELIIGARQSGRAIYPFNGAIDEVRIYNRALSADEIAAHADTNNTESGR